VGVAVVVVQGQPAPVGVAPAEPVKSGLSAGKRSSYN